MAEQSVLMRSQDLRPEERAPTGSLPLATPLFYVLLRWKHKT